MPPVRTEDSDEDYTYESDDTDILEFRAPCPLSKRNKSRKRAPSRRSPSSSTLVSEESISDDLKSSVTTIRGAKETIVVSGVTLRPTVAFDTFWRVAAERKNIDDRRRAGLPAPWTDDPILRNNFFCNTFRVLDKVSQYLIREVIEKGSQDPVDVVFRVLLFNSFTKIETWEHLNNALGPLTWKRYDRNAYAEVLQNIDGSLYTGAFIKPAPSFGYKQNYMNHLCLVESLMENELPSRLLAAEYLANVYEYLISFPSMGPFSTYQLMLCLSYTKVLNFHQNDFVISGPGSISGLNKLFGNSMALGRQAVRDFDVDVMRYMTDSQNYHFQRLGINFSGLGPKRLPMSVADIEHTLCEVDKYCRAAHPGLKGKRTNLHRKYTASETNNYAAEKMVLPKAWSHPARLVPRIRPEKALIVEKRYEISHIADTRLGPDGQRQFFVYWVGYPPEDATWEFASSLLHDAPATVAEYLANKVLNS